VVGIMATALIEEQDPALLIDIGTNGEIVLYYDGHVLAASTAAGPAFEGARLSHGMRASTGAIEKVIFDNDVHFNVIGDVPPMGICGSAIIDLTAELLDHHILSEEGRLLPPEEISSNVPTAIRKRIISNEWQVEFVVAWAENTRTGTPIVFSQRDVRELQLACGAIRAGILILLRQAGLRTADINRVLIAGGFGNFIRRNNAQRIGLLPDKIEHQRIFFVGNSSLAGARLAAVSQKARHEAEELARQTVHIDLSHDPNFHMEFAEAMLFPKSDRSNSWREIKYVTKAKK